MTPPLVELAGVSFTYRARGRHAPPLLLDGISTRIVPGSVTGILGPNGAGKTTLLRLIAGVLNPVAGTIRMAGRDLGTIPRRAIARRVAVVPQETHLAFDYAVIEIVLMGRYPHLGAFEVEGPDDLAVARAALTATGTDHLADRRFETLSGGEKQRVVIASALAQLEVPSATAVDVPPLLLLDEPTASLDLRYQIELAALLRRLHHERDVTIVLTTHDLRFARDLCSDVLLLSHGRLLAAGPTDEVLTLAHIAEAYEIDPALAAPLAG